MTCQHYAVRVKGAIRCRLCCARYDWTLDGARWLEKPTKAPDSAKKAD